MYHICIVIPCFNESKRLPVDEYLLFLKQYINILVCFVNDGSDDNTIEILNLLKTKYDKQVEVITSAKNVGKAEAVRRGINHCLDKYSFNYIGYFDADLATPLDACFKLAEQCNNKIEFCFGARILKIGSKIERTAKRHYIGRIIATFIDKILKLKVYDTQCGAKLFSRELSKTLFIEPFISKWLFDVELFARMINKYGREMAWYKMYEFPLEKWINKDGSKVKVTYFFKLWIDLLKIKRKYFKKQPKYL